MTGDMDSLSVILKFWNLMPAALIGIRAAAVKHTAIRKIDRRRNLTLEFDIIWTFLIKTWNSA